MSAMNAINGQDPLQLSDCCPGDATYSFGEATGPVSEIASTPTELAPKSEIAFDSINVNKPKSIMEELQSESSEKTFADLDINEITLAYRQMGDLGSRFETMKQGTLGWLADESNGNNSQAFATGITESFDRVTALDARFKGATRANDIEVESMTAPEELDMVEPSNVGIQQVAGPSLA